MGLGFFHAKDVTPEYTELRIYAFGVERPMFLREFVGGGDLASEPLDFPCLPFYSTDIRAAWEVVEYLKKHGVPMPGGDRWDLCLKVGWSSDLAWFVEMFDLSPMGYVTDAGVEIAPWEGVRVENCITAAHAICLAALAAVGFPVQGEMDP